MGQDRAGGRRQADRPPVGLEQRLADLALERGELLRDRGRRQVQRIGGRGDRPAVGELAQCTQAAQVNHAAELTGSDQNVDSL